MAFTKPACMIADTGVGAARVTGSQPWKGTWAAREAPAATSSSAIPSASPVGRPSTAAPSRVHGTSPPAATTIATAVSQSARSPAPSWAAVRATPCRANPGMRMRHPMDQEHHTGELVDLLAKPASHDPDRR